MEEILTYSAKQLEAQTTCQIEVEPTPTMYLCFYKGTQFTDRRSKDSKPSKWEDAVVIFEGEVDEKKITYEEMPIVHMIESTKNHLKFIL